MIKANINVTIDGHDYSGEIIVPSKVLTSTTQQEELDLAESPNFQLKLEDTDYNIVVTETVSVTFDTDDYTYTANMIVLNRAGNIVTLQYVDGLTYDDSSDSDSSDSEIDEDLSEVINNILGTNYDVINDISEQDALAAANNILYGEEQPPV